MTTIIIIGVRIMATHWTVSGYKEGGGRKRCVVLFWRMNYDDGHFNQC